MPTARVETIVPPASVALSIAAALHRTRRPSGVVVVASALDGRPVIIGAVTEDLVKRGVHAGNIAKSVATMLGGSGGGRPALAQAGGRDLARLDEALATVPALVSAHGILGLVYSRSSSAPLRRSPT
jgi:alanyl-tRNA synthetase